MPIFEFTCGSCGAEFELLVRGPEAARCPSCQGTDLQRVLSVFAVSSAERSRATLAAARRRFQQSKTQRERQAHEADEVREHVQDDYGIDLGPKQTIAPIEGRRVRRD